MACKTEMGDIRLAGPTRKELIEVLRDSAIWEDEMEHYTKSELTSLVQGLRSRNKGSTVDQEVKRISRLKKAEIQQAVQEAGLEITGQETIGQMLLAFRKHLKGTLPVEPDEAVDFGTHKGKTFAEVLTKYPDYCVWVRDQFHQNPTSCCPGMYRLACWLEGIHPGSQEMPKKEEAPPSRASASGAVPKTRGTTPVKQEQKSPRLRVPPKAKAKPTAVKSMARPTFVHPEPGWMPVDQASEVSLPEDQEDEEEF